MRLPVSQLSALLIATIKQAREAACALNKEGIANIGLEEFTVEVELVPDGGWNQIRREEITEAGEQTTLEKRPEMSTTTTQGAATTESAEPARTTTRKEVRTAEPSTTTKTDAPSTRTSSRSGGGQTATKKSHHQSEQEGGQDNRGGDVVNQDYTVEAT